MDPAADPRGEAIPPGAQGQGGSNPASDAFGELYTSFSLRDFGAGPGLRRAAAARAFSEMVGRLVPILEVLEANLRRGKQGLQVDLLRGAPTDDMKAFLRIAFDHQEQRACLSIVKAALESEEGYVTRKWMERILADGCMWWKRMRLPSQAVLHEAFPGLLRSFCLPRWEIGKIPSEPWRSGNVIELPLGWERGLWIGDSWMSERGLKVQAPYSIDRGIDLAWHPGLEAWVNLHPINPKDHHRRWSPHVSVQLWDKNVISRGYRCNVSRQPHLRIYQPHQAPYAYGGKPWIAEYVGLRCAEGKIVGEFGGLSSGLKVATEMGTFPVSRMSNRLREQLVGNPYDLIGKHATLQEDPRDGKWRLLEVK